MMNKLLIIFVLCYTALFSAKGQLLAKDSLPLIPLEKHVTLTISPQYGFSKGIKFNITKPNPKNRNRAFTYSPIIYYGNFTNDYLDVQSGDELLGAAFQVFYKFTWHNHNQLAFQVLDRFQQYYFAVGLTANYFRLKYRDRVFVDRVIDGINVIVPENRFVNQNISRLDIPILIGYRLPFSREIVMNLQGGFVYKIILDVSRQRDGGNTSSTFLDFNYTGLGLYAELSFGIILGKK